MSYESRNALKAKATQEVLSQLESTRQMAVDNGGINPLKPSETVQRIQSKINGELERAMNDENITLSFIEKEALKLYGGEAGCKEKYEPDPNFKRKMLELIVKIYKMRIDAMSVITPDQLPLEKKLALIMQIVNKRVPGANETEVSNVLAEL